MVSTPNIPRRLSLTSIWLGLFVTAAAYGQEPKQPSPELAQYDAIVRPKDREHWSFQSVPRPADRAIPHVARASWVRNPVDAFVLAKLESRGWEPSPAVEPHALVRRLFLDVVGIPPSIDEQEAFLRDAAARGIDAAIATLADDLLARPSYGERWARHWLDVVRYAETNGYERDATKPHVWRYRDYVIQSLNDDKPFDRFALEQIAGDELDDMNAESLIATGLHRLGHWDDEPADPKEDRYDQLDDMVSTTSLVFLGLSIGCARCHNHKFEPLSMHDYYRMVAIFNPLVRPQNGRTELDSPAGSRSELDALAAVERRITELTARADGIRHRQRALLDSSRSTLPAEVIAAFHTEPRKRSDAQKKLVAENKTRIDEELTKNLPEDERTEVEAIQRELAELAKTKPALPRGYFMKEPTPKAPSTYLLLRGKAARPGPEVEPGIPAVLASHQPDFLPPGPESTRRRLTLARWITAPENPLTSRVIVNRVWQSHFGEGLVRTANDFGVAGTRPTHPELLDWLAGWFVHDAGWSLKKLHRLILTSNAYRMRKRWSEAYGPDDPQNEWLWRQNYRRLEVEAIRDSMLAVSGQLNSKMFGPSMLPTVPREALDGNSDPDKIWKASDETEASRRTIYTFIKRSMIVPMLEVLDLCDSTRSSAQRQVTTIAPQALSLFNGDFVNRQSAQLAQRLVREAGPDPSRQIDHLFRLVLCRRPSASETAALLAFLDEESARLAQASAQAADPKTASDFKQVALEQACRTVFNLNEFMYTD
jgi:hypothetical protein